MSEEEVDRQQFHFSRAITIFEFRRKTMIENKWKVWMKFLVVQKG